jgi:hypothetical protein
MIKTRLVPVMVFSIVCSSAGFACDPNAVNWDQFYAINDKNNDQKIQRTEWQNLSFKGSNFESGFESELPSQQIFQQLDTNKNAVLDGQEIYYIYRYLPNPCANFNMQNTTLTKKESLLSLDKLKAFLQQLF